MAGCLYHRTGVYVTVFPVVPLKKGLVRGRVLYHDHLEKARFRVISNPRRTTRKAANIRP